MPGCPLFHYPIPPQIRLQYRLTPMTYALFDAVVLLYGVCRVQCQPGAWCLVLYVSRQMPRPLMYHSQGNRPNSLMEICLFF